MILNKKWPILVFVVLNLSLIVPAGFIATRSPVLLRVPDMDSIRGHPSYLVLNPFRDKRPEIASEQFLENMRAGKCEEIVASLNQEEPLKICEKQKQYPLLSWKLLDVEVNDGIYQIIYKHTSKNAVGNEEIGVWLKKSGDVWNVNNFNIGY